jgi:rare lipoprotein A
MDGNLTFRMRALLAAVAMVAAGGSIGAVQAAGEAEPPVSPQTPAALTAPVELPHFVPTAEPVEAEPAATAEAAAPEWLNPDEAVIEEIPSGVASWYGPGFAGRKTANGERFDPGQMTAAHRTLPFGSKVRVTRNGKSVVVRINDRGPFHGGRVIDLSQAAAAELGLVRAGSGHVELALVSS